MATPGLIKKNGYMYSSRSHVRRAFSTVDKPVVFDKADIERRMNVRSSAYPLFQEPRLPPKVFLKRLSLLGSQSREDIDESKPFYISQWPKSLEKHRMSSEEIVQELRKRLNARSGDYHTIAVRFKNANNTKSNGGGGTEEAGIFAQDSREELDCAAFHKLLCEFHLCPSKEQSAEIFKLFDVDGDGSVTLREFFLKILEDDYPNATDECLMMTESGHDAKKLRSKSQPEEFLERYYQLTDHNVLIALQNKISQRVSRGNDQYRQIHNLFGEALSGSDHSGLGEQGLQRLFQSLQIPASEEECHILFGLMDFNGDGKLTLEEFVNVVMPDDYPLSSSEFIAKEAYADPAGLSTRRYCPQKDKIFREIK